ncbi:MAG: hypothetical protein DI539_05505 [Flavobacterium psychrophilum]|nr:MAG: hypothetical protein DI539_05505 [Flavobacterium psychrophilum]
MEYPKWYSQMAAITIGESVYRICPTGFWNFRYEIIKDGKVVFTVKNTWKGYVITKAMDDERPLTLAPKGFFKGGYVIKNHKDEVVLEVHSDFQWKKFTQDYRVICNDDLNDAETGTMLPLLSVYFYIEAQAAAAGAA